MTNVITAMRSFTGRIWYIHELDFCCFFESSKMSEKNCKNSGSRLHSIDYHPPREGGILLVAWCYRFQGEALPSYKPFCFKLIQLFFLNQIVLIRKNMQ